MKTIVMLCALLLLPAILISQETVGQPWLTDSSKSIQFGISSNLTLTTFSYAGFSYQFHLTQSRAIRLTLTLSGSTANSDTHEEHYLNDTLVSIDDNTDKLSSSYGVGVSALHIWYMQPSERFFLFTGVGPTVTFSYDKYDPGRPYDYWTKTTSLGVGVFGAIGGGYFVDRRFAIHAEYQAGASYAETRFESYSHSSPPQVVTTIDQHTHRWSLRSPSVLFGLSLYW